ncbi:unnamed protein product, partial [Ectocarpus sp. 12 AP-2014]
SRVVGEAGGKDEDLEMAIAPAGGLGRRVLLVECPEGYFGDSCSECASGFVETEGGECEAARSRCTVGNAVRAVVFIALAVLILCFTLDTLWNGKSPPRRIAQMWRGITDRGSQDEAAPMSASSHGRSSKHLAAKGAGARTAGRS